MLHRLINFLKNAGTYRISSPVLMINVPAWYYYDFVRKLKHTKKQWISKNESPEKIEVINGLIKEYEVKLSNSTQERTKKC